MTEGRIMVWTDGACKGNPGPGGWGVLLVYGEHRKELCGGDISTTNNRMELTAVIRALDAIKAPGRLPVTVHLDSEYVRKGITEWIHGWKKSGRLDGGDVQNADLWRQLDALSQSFGDKIEWIRVKGHSGDPGNERADALANRGFMQVVGMA